MLLSTNLNTVLFMGVGGQEMILIILAIVIPPLAVYLYFGEINIHFWLCLLFCFVGFGLLNLYWGFGALYALLSVLGIFG